jgi:urease accessory protein
MVAREGRHFLFAAIPVKVKNRYFGSSMINLRLLQLGDSALPVGGYTHSWGLETALARRLVHDAATLERWTRSWLRESLGPLEGVVVASVCRSLQDGDGDEIAGSNRLIDASLSPMTLRTASREMGRQLLQLAETWEWSRPRVTEIQADREKTVIWHYCVAFGALAGIAEATPAEALGVFLNQAVLGMIAAGVRGIPIGHTHAQQILAYLHGDLEELTRSLEGEELQTAGSGSPYYEVLCHEQPRLYTRLFRS